MVDPCSMHYIKTCVEILNLSTKKEFTCCLSAPTAVPTNLQVSNTSSTSKRVTWNPPPQNETHGIIRQYDIRYQKVECNSSANNSSSAWVERNVNGSTTSLDITGLMKWSCYEVEVRAVTIKNGPWSGTEERRTSEDGKIIISLSY